MELREEMKVKLFPFKKDNVDFISSPGVNISMEEYFGGFVTIKKVIDRETEDEVYFTIYEDSGKWTYTSRWIQSYNILPDELFRI